MQADVCSAKGCQAPAVWDLQWNNPKLHTPERRKVWLACDAHRESLSHFLGSRAFLKDVVAHERTEEPGDPGQPTDGDAVDDGSSAADR